MEKRLTDEEIVKVLDTCFMAGGNGDCGKCALFTGNGLGECMRNVAVETLDLIQRLQGEKSLAKRDAEVHKTIVDGQIKIIDEQKAEIERLKEENKNLLIKVRNYEKPARTPLYSNESMINCNLVTCYNENADLRAKNAELQKQVDELKDRKIEPLIVKCSSLETCPKVEQAVKETAREICDLILEHWEKKQFVECDWLRVAISEKYGVEVE